MLGSPQLLRGYIQDPDLAIYYTKLHDVTSGPLFNGQRLLEIWNFNTGAYNSLLHHYIQSIPPASQSPIIPAKLIHGKIPIKKPSKPKIRPVTSVSH